MRQFLIGLLLTASAWGAVSAATPAPCASSPCAGTISFPVAAGDVLIAVASDNVTGSVISLSDSASNVYTNVFNLALAGQVTTVFTSVAKTSTTLTSITATGSGSPTKVAGGLLDLGPGWSVSHSLISGTHSTNVCFSTDSTNCPPVTKALSPASNSVTLFAFGLAFLATTSWTAGQDGNGNTYTLQASRSAGNGSTAIETLATSTGASNSYGAAFTAGSSQNGAVILGYAFATGATLKGKFGMKGALTIVP